MGIKLPTWIHSRGIKCCCDPVPRRDLISRPAFVFPFLSLLLIIPFDVVCVCV
jgi:hypothetical protein